MSKVPQAADIRSTSPPSFVALCAPFGKAAAPATFYNCHASLRWADMHNIGLFFSHDVGGKALLGAADGGHRPTLTFSVRSIGPSWAVLQRGRQTSKHRP